MPGPIFMHFQTYSRKSNVAGNTVDQVIEEGCRDAEFSQHVDAPQPPRPIIGDPATFKGVHDAHVAARATKVMVKGVERSRAIRTDRHTLATIIASYPLTHEQIAEGGDAARAHHAAWECDTVAYVRQKYGDQLKVAFAHEDEPHPHLHFWLLPDNPDADAKLLHPGKAAKAAVEAIEKAAGAEPKAAVKAGNLALKAAMRETLDEYHRIVGEPLGMLRDGPKRRRLSRAQYRAELDEAARRSKSIERAEKADQIADEARASGYDAGLQQGLEAAADEVQRLQHENQALRSENQTLRSQIADLVRAAGAYVRHRLGLDPTSKVDRMLLTLADQELRRHDTSAPKEPAEEAAAGRDDLPDVWR